MTDQPKQLNYDEVSQCKTCHGDLLGGEKEGDLCWECWTIIHMIRGKRSTHNVAISTTSKKVGAD